MLRRNYCFRLYYFIVLCWFFLVGFAAKLPQEEVDALRQIVSTLGATIWKFDAESCKIEMVGVTQQAPPASDSNISCDCSFDNNKICHIKSIMIKGYSLPGVLPPELVKLPYLQEIDFAYNFLSGTIPIEWSSTHLKSISVLGNRLSGEIPENLANITSLTYLNLEANQFSGTVPSQLGGLLNLENLILSSNQLTGTLPAALSQLKNLTDFRINDNNFTGPIPDFMQNWKKLNRLEIQATGLEGPIPLSISALNMLTDLRISDIDGPAQHFPIPSTMTGLNTLVLRNCNIFGGLPVYIWNLKFLEVLDLSFNKLVGEIPNNISARSLLKLVFLTRNMLSGNVPASILKDGRSIDLSYNNFTWQGPEQPACRPNMNLYINLYRSSSSVGNILRDILPCVKDFSCPRYGCSLYVNCGGNDLKVEESDGRKLYEGDAQAEGGTAKLFFSGNVWGFSSTGDFMDDDNYQNTRFIVNEPSKNLPELYKTARLSPLSLTYFRYCTENGDYNVRLHFSETIFTNDSTYNSLGRRIFDIYVQDTLVRKNFNIEEKAGGIQKPVVEQVNASVTNNVLEIRFYWAGKGTTRFPVRGVYGPLVSAISVKPKLKSCLNGRKNNIVVYIIIGMVAFCIASSMVGILFWKRCLGGKEGKDKDFEGLHMRTVSFTLKQIKAATKNFDLANKIGEGGFGPVYKGLLSDGTIIAVKQLSSKSTQGNREFQNEIGMISCLQHPNLVKLHGCCVEGDQLLLVYEYMENNSLARALFGNSELVLDWPARFKICIGIAKGLAFLHEESRFKIVHRDIKATNVLLDKDLNPKISDFGLARLNEDQKSHISTRIAGTIGYMAPEYALWGYLTYKVDVYSFGVVILEIVSGKNNNNYMPSNNCICLLDWACLMHHNENVEEIIDRRLLSHFNKEEADRMVKVALLCTNVSPVLRPTMSEAVNMLKGQMTIPEDIPEPGTYSEDYRFKAIKDFRREKQGQGFDNSQTQNSNIQTDVGSSSTFTTKVHEIPNSAST